jgi:hypothetical protein
MKHTLAENMLRFGVKNLKESDIKHIKQAILQEQNPNAGVTMSPTAGQSAKVDDPTVMRSGLQSTPFNIQGFQEPKLANFENIAKYNQAFEAAYGAYLGDYKSMIGKQILIFKQGPAGTVAFTPENLIRKFGLYSFARLYDAQNPYSGFGKTFKVEPGRENPTTYLFWQPATTNYTGRPNAPGGNSENGAQNSQTDLAVRIAYGSAAAGHKPTWSVNPNENLQFTRTGMEHGIGVPDGSVSLITDVSELRKGMVPGIVTRISQTAPIGTLLNVKFVNDAQIKN